MKKNIEKSTTIITTKRLFEWKNSEQYFTCCSDEWLLQSSTKYLRPTYPPFQCYWWKLIQQRDFAHKKKILFNTGKRGEGMLHTFRMIFLLKLTAVSICFVEGCRLTKFVTVFLLGKLVNFLLYISNVSFSISNIFLYLKHLSIIESCLR